MSAKVLLVLFLALGTTSFIYGKRIHEANPGLKVKLAAEEKKLVQLERDAKILASSLTPDAELVKLEPAITNTVLAIMRNRVSYGVTISTIAPQKIGIGSGSASELAKMAEPIPGSKVQSVRLNMRGSYASYDGFSQYLSELRRFPASIVHLKVEGNTFEMGLRVYGN